jgi:hypothetical protein
MTLHREGRRAELMVVGPIGLDPLAAKLRPDEW